VQLRPNVLSLDYSIEYRFEYSAQPYTSHASICLAYASILMVMLSCHVICTFPSWCAGALFTTQY